MHAFRYRALRSAVGVVLAVVTTHAAHADEHAIFNLEPDRSYDVLVDGSTVHSNLQPGPTRVLIFDAPGGQVQVVAAGEGDTTPPAAIDDLAAAAGEPGEVTLSWTAPGDDGNTGQASAYEIRWATTPSGLDASPVLVGDAPAPGPAGSAESHLVTGLPSGVTVYLAVRARDDVGNWGDGSNVADAPVAGGGETDTTPPARIDDLAAAGGDPGDLTLTWTAPGDDGQAGRAAAYEIRWAQTASDLEESPTFASDPPAPSAAGSDESHVLAGLPEGTVFVAIRARDDAGNWGALSNAADAVVAGSGGGGGGGEEDTTPPGTIDDLAAAPGDPGELALTWTAPGDDGETGQAAAYEIRWATSLADLDTSPTFASAPPPSPAGSDESHVLTGLPEAETVLVAIRARDEAQNWSERSNVAEALVAGDGGGSGSGGGDADSTPPAVIANFTLTRVNSHRASLSWTATGDDGTSGRAASYELRFSTVPIDELNFETATPAPTSAPGNPGSEEREEVEQLESRTRYYLAIRAVDDAGNVSPVSENVIAETRGNDNTPNPPGNANGWMNHGRMSLEWENTLDPAVVGYHVYRLPDGDALETRLTPEPVDALSFEDATVEEGVGYTYRITAVDDEAMESTLGVTVWARAISSVPARAVIEAMYPNPARASDAVTFRIGIPEVGPGNPDGRHVTVDLYDVAGRKIARLYDGYVLPGVREVTWQPQAARSMAPGMYVTLVKAGGHPVSGRLAITR